MEYVYCPNTCWVIFNSRLVDPTTAVNKVLSDLILIRFLSSFYFLLKIQIIIKQIRISNLVIYLVDTGFSTPLSAAIYHNINWWNRPLLNIFLIWRKIHKQTQKRMNEYFHYKLSCDGVNELVEDFIINLLLISLWKIKWSPNASGYKPCVKDILMCIQTWQYRYIFPFLRKPSSRFML